MYKVELVSKRQTCRNMLKAMKRVSETMGLSYPEEYLPRIAKLKSLGEKEIANVVEEILSQPQEIVGSIRPRLLNDAIQESLAAGQTNLEFKAPLLTFPRATPTQWNGEIDHLDTITGTYTLYLGEPWQPQYGPHLLKTFKGAPQIVPALQKALGRNVQVLLKIDAYSNPSSRFVLHFR